MMKTIRSKTGARRLQKEYLQSHDLRLELAFLLQDWDDPYNVGGLFRVADACGAKEVILSGKTPAPPHPQIAVTSLGSHRRVKTRQIERYNEAVDQLKSEGYTLIAVEIAEDAIPFNEFTFPAKVCLVLGNEVHGVYDSVLQRCDAAVFIPMAGKGRSMNVHVAASVVAFHALFAAQVEAG
jgi:23S rRNA (guanosine2251-2'-O)-methyltransferase